MKIFLEFLICYLLISSISLKNNNIYAQQTLILIDTLDFGLDTVGQSKIITLKVGEEISAGIQNIYFGSKLNLFIPDSAFSIQNFISSQLDSVKIIFHPKHNLNYNTFLIYSYSYSYQMSGGFYQGGIFSIPIMAIAIYSDSIYNSTNNLSEETLKDELKNLISQNYNSLGYDAARDSMFMIIDNQLVNGQGAGTNTLESCYTGIVCANYIDRWDAQNTCNFNTEHTWPQSAFGSSEPMLSDLYHLFVCDGSSNSQRGNFPFRWVNSPTWTAGGSEYENGMFEPRNEQKGQTARAIFYFATMYGNQGNYLDFNQQSDLKDWNHLFLPDSVEEIRNNKIEEMQLNRNPFIDHPEFADRINSFVDSSFEQPFRELIIADDSILVLDNFNISSDTISFTLFNSGNLPVNIYQLIPGNSVNQSFVNDAIFDSIIQPGKTGKIKLALWNSSGDWNCDDFSGVIINSNSNTSPDTIKFCLASMEGLDDLYEESSIKISPNPVGDYFNIDVKGFSGKGKLCLKIFNEIGVEVVSIKNWEINNSVLLNKNLANGMYYIKLIDEKNNCWYKKFVKTSP